jgi:hypothetical protein
MTENITAWKELEGTGGMEVRAVTGVIVVQDAKTGQRLVFSEADYAAHRRRILQRNWPLALLRLLERATSLVRFAVCVLELARYLRLH